MPWDEIKPRRFKAFEKELDGISRQTMDDHYRLYEGYVKKTNECRKILNEFDYSEIEGNQVYSPLRAVSVDYTFALLGFKNHDLYFGHLGGDGGEPEGRATPDGRKQYVEALFRNLDWDHVNRQLTQAEAAKQGADQAGASEPSVA
jgi:superoxide dismutase